MTPYKIVFPGFGKIPPQIMEEVALTKDDVLLHLRTDDDPYMIILEEGTWTHLVGCVLAYVLQQSHIFDACVNSYLLELSKDQEKFNLFKPILKERQKKGK